MKRKIIFLVVLTVVFTSALGLTGLDTGTAMAQTMFQRINFVDAVVTAQNLNVRQGPGTTFPVVCVLRKGQTVKVFGKVGNWYAVYEPGKGCVGAASSNFLQATTAAPAPAVVPKASAAPKTSSTAKPLQPVAPPSGISTDEQVLLNLVNNARANAGAAPLSFDVNLVKTARLKAQDMVDNNYFSHQSPTYGSPFDMMKQFGITFRTAGENIAGNSTVQGAFNAWMNSPGHKANILNGSFDYTGIGIVNSPTYCKILVQQFIGK